MHAQTKLDGVLRIQNKADIHFGELEYSVTNNGGLIHLNPLGVFYPGTTGYHVGSGYTRCERSAR